MKNLPKIGVVHPHSGEQPFTSAPIERPAGTPMPPEEVEARLRHVFAQSHGDYHFFPSPEDHEALEAAAEALDVVIRARELLEQWRLTPAALDEEPHAMALCRQIQSVLTGGKRCSRPTT